MDELLPEKWLKILDIVDIAFQPILNIHTARLYAVEALLRDFKDAGFKSIFALFDAVYCEGLLYPFDIKLREKALRKFTTIEDFQEIKLFYNLDNRLFEIDNFSYGNTQALLKKFNIKQDNICFEISERQEISTVCDISAIMQHYRDEEFDIAIDDFGVGHSGYKLLYETTPNLIKIDRFFLTDISKNMKKKILVKNIVYLAILLGVKVVAEGIETKEELLTCRDIGCHLIQGYLIQRPTQDTTDIVKEYTHIAKIVAKDQRSEKTSDTITEYLDLYPSLNIKTKMKSVIEYFKENPEFTILPIVNGQDEPLGLVLERDIKDFLYSPYGISILLNNTTKKSKLENLLTPCVSADINSKLTTIIDLYSSNPESIGIIITKNSHYVGFLSARAIITIINEYNILSAREQNPLTKLPGNSKIEEYIQGCTHSDTAYLLCYFDLDNFKAYNDVYGFRNGDRVIILFSEILQKRLPNDFFIGHIGGDDFFVAVEYDLDDEKKLIKILQKIIIKFGDDVKGFYHKEDQEKGYIVSKDREGNIKNFPFLSVSASALTVTKRNDRDVETINLILSKQKKIAKHSSTRFCMSCLL
jgi:EAL domain-containing protein (putative c-di-GMP-specific phosphodiesterase class I)/GGDEF domain-containing protein